MTDEVVALGAWCEFEPEDASRASPGSISFAVSEFAQLADGSRVILHQGERGFSGSGPQGDSDHPLGDITAESIRSGVLMTVLPDEDDGENHPWEWLAERLLQHGVAVSPETLKTLPYTVELSDRVHRLLEARSRDLAGHLPAADTIGLGAAVPGLAPAEVNAFSARCEDLALQWDLPGLLAELRAALAGVPVSRQTYVPNELRHALELFVDAYAKTHRNGKPRNASNEQ